MRFLFSFAGGTGHFVPTVVFAQALARRVTRSSTAAKKAWSQP